MRRHAVTKIIKMMIMSNLKISDKRKPTQGGLRGVLDYIQTAGNLVKGDAIALLKVDPLIRLYFDYNKKHASIGKNNPPLPQGEGWGEGKGTQP